MSVPPSQAPKAMAMLKAEGMRLEARSGASRVLMRMRVCAGEPNAKTVAPQIRTSAAMIHGAADENAHQRINHHLHGKACR